jgi:RND family efflux transporter MFP subunit
VRKGQILATTDANIINKSIDQLQTNLDLATIAYDKQKRLWDQKIGSEIQFLSAKTQKESLEKQLKTLQSQIDLTVIKSPINGVVDDINVKIGEMASPGFTGIRVVNLSNIKVVAKVSDNYIAKVKKGQSVIVRFPDANYEITAPVSFVSSVIGANRSFNVEVKVNNKDAMIKPNMVASLLISDQKLSNVLVVPSNAIEHTATGNYLMVVTGTKDKYTASRRKVERRRRAESACANHQHACVQQLCLTVSTNAREKEVTRVARLLLWRQRGRLNNREASGAPASDATRH